MDTESILRGVEELTVSTWEYKTREGVKHMGPMAGEFHETFSLGADSETIGHVDADGVALAAIQGLSKKLDEKDDRIADLEAENAHLRERLGAVEDRLSSLEGDQVAAPVDD